jgi:hypothetical protein
MMIMAQLMNDKRINWGRWSAEDAGGNEDVNGLTQLAEGRIILSGCEP